MRTAIISDIHGNLEALTAVLDDIASIGADRIICLGDIVGYGADPQACVEIIAGLTDRTAAVLKGNHDDAIENGTAGMRGTPAIALAWTVTQLTADARRFLAGLPMTHREDDVLYVHASANAPADWHYVLGEDDATASLRATDARLTFSGHTHVPRLFHIRTGAPSDRKAGVFVPVPNTGVPLSAVQRYHAVIGSVGQPRDGNPAACWGLFDGRAITWRRVPYDIETAMRKIKDAGLPERLWMRLILGH